MNILRTIRSFSWLQMLFICAVGALVISSVLQALTPERVDVQPVLTQNFRGTTSTFGAVTYTGELFVLPQELAIGEVTAQKTDHDYFRDRLVSLYDLKQDPELPILWRNDHIVLTGGDDSFQYTLVNTLARGKTVIMEHTAVEAAQEIVAAIYEDNPPMPDLENLSYYSSEGKSHPEEVLPSQATLIVVPFKYSFESLPLYVADSIFDPITVSINSSYEVQKIDLTPQTVTVASTKKIKTVPLASALQQIEDGNGSIISAEYPGHGTPSIDSISQAIFSQASLEYRADTESSTVVPYYHFVGQLVNDQGVTFTGHVITPAVQTEFAQK